MSGKPIDEAVVLAACNLVRASRELDHCLRNGGHFAVAEARGAMLHRCDALEATLTAAQQQGHENPWQLAVDQARVTAHLGIAADNVTREEAAKQLAELIDWHVAVATDPVVNGGLSLQPVQQGQAVAWYTDDHLSDRSATTYDPVVRDRWIAKGWPVAPLYAAPQSAPADTAPPPSAPVGVGLPPYRQPADPYTTAIPDEYARGWNDCRAAVASTLAQQPAAVDGAMRKVAAIAHSGGLIDMSPHDALTAIRRLSLPYWGKEEKPEQVHVTLATQHQEPKS